MKHTFILGLFSYGAALLSHTDTFEGLLGEDRPETPLTFWQSDLHAGTRADVTSLLTSSGHKVINAGRRRKSPYPSIFNNSNVTNLDLKDMAPLIQLHMYVNQKLRDVNVREMFDFYKTSEHRQSIMSTVDAFVCMFPLSFCEAYMPYNRTILWLAAHRYSLGRCTLKEWERLNDHLIMSATSEAHRPRSIVAAMNLYDAEYINYFTGITPVLLEATSFGYLPVASSYKPTRREILIAPSNSQYLSNLTRLPSHQFATVEGLYNFYQLEDLLKHPAAVIFPYAVFSYFITELYGLNIPLFVPDLDFMLKLGCITDRCNSSPLYCRHCEVPKRHSSSRHQYSPEDQSHEAQKYWLNFSTFFQWPHITYFNSFEDLGRKLSNVDLHDIHNLMVEENQRRKVRMQQGWKSVFRAIDHERRLIPRSYDAAVRHLWNSDGLLV